MIGPQTSPTQSSRLKAAILARACRPVFGDNGVVVVVETKKREQDERFKVIVNATVLVIVFVVVVVVVGITQALLCPLARESTVSILCTGRAGWKRCARKPPTKQTHMHAPPQLQVGPATLYLLQTDIFPWTCDRRATRWLRCQAGHLHTRHTPHSCSGSGRNPTEETPSLLKRGRDREGPVV